MKNYLKILITMCIILTIFMSNAAALDNVTANATANVTTAQTSTPVPTVTVVATTPGKFRLAPSVSLTSTKNNVEATDPAILTLSMINPSVNDINLQVDVILKAPSGVYVSATSFASSGSNQNIGHFNVRPGEENHVTIQITSTEIGEKAIESQVVYFPEGNKDDYHQLQQTMSVSVKEKSVIIKPTPIEPESTNSEKTSNVNVSAPGFSGVITVIGLIGVILLIKRRKDL
jgi:hypothetical protein